MYLLGSLRGLSRSLLFSSRRYSDDSVLTPVDLVTALARKDEDHKNHLTCSSEVLDLALENFPHTLNISTLTKVAESADLYRQISKSNFDFHRDYKPSFPQFRFMAAPGL